MSTRMTRGRCGRDGSRHGTALVAMLVLLALMALVAFATAKSGSRDQIGSLDRMQGTRAQFAVEAAARLAVKEMSSNTDLDGDGGIGTISNDSNTATDPTINNGTRMWVTRDDANGVTTLTAHAQNADAARAMIVTMGGSSSSSGTVYYSKSGSSNIYKSVWDGSTWTESSVGTMSANGRWFRALQNPAGTVTVLGATDQNSKLTGMTATTGSFGSATTLDSNAGSTAVRKFDIAFEQNSGDGMIAFSNGSDHDAMYRVVTGSTIGSAGTVFSGSTYIDCVRLYSRPGSDQILFMASDYNEDLRARIWSGSSWGTTSTLSTSVESAFAEAFGGAFMSSSGTPLAVYCKNNTAAPKYRVYSSGSWSSEQSMAECSDTAKCMLMAPRPGTDQVVAVILDKNAEIRAYVWNGSSWTSNTKLCSNAGYIDCRPFGMAWSTDGSTLLVVYGSNNSIPRYRTFDGSSWSSESNLSNIGDKPRWVQVSPASSGSRMAVAISDAGSDLHTFFWDGSSMGTMGTVTSTLGGSTGTEAFWMMPPGGGGSGGGVSVSAWTPVNP